MKKVFCFIWIIFFFNPESKSQTINYVTNGSFEDCVKCDTVPYKMSPIGWTDIDGNLPGPFIYCSMSSPISNLPYMLNSFQLPSTGEKIILSSVLCGPAVCSYTNSRWYPRNKLKGKLKKDKIYCVTFSVINRDVNPVGISAFGMYFCSNTIDTIKYTRVPLTYLTPQVANPAGNFILDTLNWSVVTNTFSANGDEENVVLGNFQSTASTTFSFINQASLNAIYTDIFYDDVSCIELNAPAYAGPDQAFKVGDSLYLGSPRDFAVDELCRWYQLPGNIALDTAAGIWVKPTETSTYVVRQEICGLVKWDTVVVFKDAVGLGEDPDVSALSLYPNPFSEVITLKTNDASFNGNNRLIIFDQLGLIVREEELFVKNQSATIDLRSLRPGVYLLQIANTNGSVSKRITKCE